MTRKFEKILYPLIVIFIFLVSFFLYSWTASRGTYLVDSGEFITAIKVIGIAHPPGFPTYILLGKLFSSVPLADSFAFKVSLFSAVASAFSLSLLVICTRLFLKLKDKISIPSWVQAGSILLAVCILGTRSVFWEQSNVAEVYSLNLFFILGLLFLALKFRQTSNWKYFYLGSFIAGLGLGNHPILLFFLPSLGLFCLWGKLRIQKSGFILNFLAGSTCFFIGLSVYLYVPLRSMTSPELDWGHTSRSLQHLYNHLTRLDYKDFGVLSDLSDKLQFALAFISSLWEEFGALLFLSAVGAVLMYKKFFSGFGIVLALFLTAPLSMIFLRSVEFSQAFEELYAQNYLPSYVAITIWLVFGIYGLYSIFAKLKGRLSSIILLWLVLIGFLAQTVPDNFKRNNLRHFQFLEHYTQRLFALEPNSVLVLSTEGAERDTVGFAMLYGQKVLGLRPDITVVSYPNIFATADEEIINKIYSETDARKQRTEFIKFLLGSDRYKNRPIYTTFLAESSDYNGQIHSQSNGYVYKINSIGIETPVSMPLEISDNDKAILRSDYFGRDVLAQVYYAQAASTLQNGNYGRSQEYYLEAIKYDNDLLGVDMASYRAFRDYVLNQK